MIMEALHCFPCVKHRALPSLPTYSRKSVFFRIVSAVAASEKKRGTPEEIIFDTRSCAWFHISSLLSSPVSLHPYQVGQAR